MARNFVAASSEGLDGTQSTALNAQAYPVCFSAWINFDIANSPYTILEVRDVGASGNPRMQLTKTGDDNLQYFIDDGPGVMGVIAGATDAMSAGTWYHCLAWSNNDSDHHVYITALGGSFGGVANNSSTTQIDWFAADQTHVGYLASFSGVNYFDGKIAEVACWDGTIPTDGQRRALAAGFSPAHFTTGLRSYWPLFGRHSPETAYFGEDHLTLVNTPDAADHVPGIFYPRRKLVGVPASATAYSLAADGTSYTWTGQAASLEAARVLTAEAGSYSWTGTAASLEKGSVLAAEAAGYAWAGADAGLLKSSVLGADAASYSWTGQDATLTHLSGAVLAADPAAYTWDGTAAGLLHHKGLNAEAAPYVWSGFDATFSAGAVAFGITVPCRLLLEDGCSLPLDENDPGFLMLEESILSALSDTNTLSQGLSAMQITQMYDPGTIRDE